MKKLLVISLMTIACLLVFTACDRKQHAIDNLSDFVEKVKKNAPEYTTADWEEVDKEYNEIITEIEKYDYSNKETERIAELKGKFAGIKAKEDVKNLIDGVDKAINEVKSTLKGFKDGILSNEIKPLGNDADSSGDSNN